MKFEEMMPYLRNGAVVTREVFSPELVIFMQIPATISPDKVVNMASVPPAMKLLLLVNGCEISYHDQFVMYSFEDESCTYYPFDGEDVNADDWTIVSYMY